MCYLVAKDFNKQGSFALRTNLGTHLNDLINELESQVDIDRIQLVTISRPSAYSEYAPYEFAQDETDFKEKVTAM